MNKKKNVLVVETLLTLFILGFVNSGFDLFQQTKCNARYLRRLTSIHYKKLDSIIYSIIIFPNNLKQPTKPKQFLKKKTAPMAQNELSKNSHRAKKEDIFSSGNFS